MMFGQAGGLLKFAKSTTAPLCSGNGAMMSANTAARTTNAIKTIPAIDSGRERTMCRARLMAGPVSGGSED